ncbi:hypothetical protein TNCV_2929401 [Trichonephila clavipes]|nr:hypothetical protein TNCV_2929401 [Trichonephila clavipes]
MSISHKHRLQTPPARAYVYVRENIRESEPISRHAVSCVKPASDTVHRVRCSCEWDDGASRYIDEVLLPHARSFRGVVGDKCVFMDDNEHVTEYRCSGLSDNEVFNVSYGQQHFQI